MEEEQRYEVVAGENPPSLQEEKLGIQGRVRGLKQDIELVHGSQQILGGRNLARFQWERD